MTYPFQSDGTWHDGEHVKKELVVLPYVAETVAFRDIINYFFPSRDLIFIDKEEYDKFTDEEKSLWSEQNGLIYKIKDTVNEKLLQKICKRLGMVANGNFLLLKHFINAGRNEFVFYSMYSNLVGINSEIFETTENIGGEKISYINKRSSGNLILFPNTYLAQPDTVYENDGMKKYYQVDYFVSLDTAKGIFRNNEFLLSGNECCRMEGNYALYKKQDVGFQQRDFLKDTYFEILDYPDEQRYINAAKIRAYLVPAKIQKEPEEPEINEGTVNFNLFKIQSFNIFHYKEGQTIGYLRENNLIGKKQERYVYEYKSIRCEITINGEPSEKYVSIYSIETPYNKIFPCILLYNNMENIIPEEFFVELDISIFKEVYIHGKRMLKLRENSKIKCYESNPALVKMEGQKQQKTINLAIKKCDVNCLNTEHIKTDGIHFYYRIENDLYIKVPENFSECHADLCTDFFLLEKSDLDGIDDKERSPYDKQKRLGKIIEEKFGGDIKPENCLIEHSSEWGGKEKNLKYKIFEILHKEIQIWDNTNKNGSLPKEIQDCSNFCYFYADTFEVFLMKLHRSYADKLRRIQDTVMHKWMYKKGNLGLYPENYKSDGQADNKQTFCNHAVFETIIKVDGNFNNFTGRGKSSQNPHRNPRLESFPECPSPKTYPYKPSNYWCDILERQASKSSETGIYKIKAENAEQAFYMAQLGYVVIAAWKNTSNNGSPHFVTVRPCEGEYPGLESLLVAHVGGGSNRTMTLIKAFNAKDDIKKQGEIKFYCNIQQCFI